jgi:hypothetical protein
MGRVQNHNASLISIKRLWRFDSFFWKPVMGTDIAPKLSFGRDKDVRFVYDEQGEGMKHRALCIRSLLAAAMAVPAAVIVLEITEPPFYYAWKQQRMVQHVLKTNPVALRQAGRELLDGRPRFLGEIDPKSASVPDVLRRLKPTRITFWQDAVYVDFSDLFNPFGIAVSVPGHRGHPQHGRHEWISGLWLFDDGQLERTKQPWRKLAARAAHP